MDKLKNPENLLIKEYSTIYDVNNNKLKITLDMFGGDMWFDLLKPGFFLNNDKYINEEIPKIKTGAIDGDIVIEHYNESGAAYISFMMIVGITSEKLSLHVGKEELFSIIETTLKLLPEVIYNSKYFNTTVLNCPTPAPPVSHLEKFKALPEEIRYYFWESQVFYYGVYYGINKAYSFFGDEKIKKKQGNLLNPIFDSMSHFIVPIFKL